MIIDTNAWIGAFPFRALRDNTPDPLVARLDRCGIDMAAVSPIEALFHRHPQPANEHLAKTLAPYRDRLIPLATLNPQSPYWARDLDACVAMGMKGVRIYPPYQGYSARDEAAREVALACAERNLPLLIPNRMEDSRQHHWMDPGRETGLDALADLTAASPTTKLVIANARGIIGSPLWTREDARRGHWFVDLSLTEIHYSLHRSVDHMRDLAEFMDAGGTDRIVFGSHLPISYAGPALVKSAILKVTPDQLESILYRTAAGLFDCNGSDAELQR